MGPRIGRRIYKAFVHEGCGAAAGQLGLSCVHIQEKPVPFVVHYRHPN